MLNNLRPGTYRKRCLKIKKPVFEFEAKVLVALPRYRPIIESPNFVFIETLNTCQTPDFDGFLSLVRIKGHARSRVEFSNQVFNHPLVRSIQSIKLLRLMKGEKTKS